MKDIKIRALKAEEIECKVAQVSAKGVQLLLYKDARCDKRILDETFGMMKWADCYSEIKGNLYCSIMLYDEVTGMWIQKQDCGVESAFGDKEKGEASDAFKRACFNVGIGRELYTKIFIWINAETVPSGKKDKSGKDIYKLKDQFQSWFVNYIETDNEKEKITYIEIADAKTKQVEFKWGTKGQVKTEKKPTTTNKTEEKTTTTKKTEEKPKVVVKEQLDELLKEANGRGDLVVKVAEDFGYDNPRKIKVEDFEKVKTAIQAEILM
jgi:hypothetical protein